MTNVEKYKHYRSKWREMADLKLWGCAADYNNALENIWENQLTDEERDQINEENGFGPNMWETSKID